MINFQKVLNSVKISAIFEKIIEIFLIYKINWNFAKTKFVKIFIKQSHKVCFNKFVNKIWKFLTKNCWNLRKINLLTSSKNFLKLEAIYVNF